MHADAKKLLWDAQKAAQRVARFTAGKTFADYERDELLRSAVERQLEIVGEALNRLRRADPATAASIRDIDRIIGFRNIVVHGYATLDDRIVWGIVESYVPALEREIGALARSCLRGRAKREGPAHRKPARASHRAQRPSTPSAMRIRLPASWRNVTARLLRPRAGERSRTAKRKVPEIRLSGAWLERMGFPIGAEYLVSVEREFRTIILQGSFEKRTRRGR
jgi:uncharacterized protein with HEPN domain